MIQSTSPSDRTGGTDAISQNFPPRARTAPQDPGQDRVSSENLQNLRQALASQPEVRPEVVAKGLRLVADPNYPSAEVIGRVASAILNSPDLSEDPS